MYDWAKHLMVDFDGKRPALVYLDDGARRFTNWEDVRKTYA